MLQPGNILYFSEYYFSNGNTSKPKYLIVLGEFKNRVIVYTLPTSQDKVPSFWVTQSGCNESESDGLSFYFFPANEIIALDTNFAFSMDTYLMGEGVDDQEFEYFNNIYNLEKDCQYLGKLNSLEYNRLIDCFSKSKAVRNKHKRILQMQLSVNS